MQTWSSKAQHSGLNKAHFSNTATEKYQERKKKIKSHTHLEKSIQDTKLKWKGCSPKSRQKINMDLALVFQRHPKSGAALWGRCCVHGRWQRGGAAPAQAPPGTAQGTPGAASSLSVSFPASISAQVLLTQCHLQFLGTGSYFWRFLSISFYRVGFNVGFWGGFIFFS